MDDAQTHARAALEEVCARGDLIRARELYVPATVDFPAPPLPATAIRSPLSPAAL